jgi:hypothetical protein
VSRDLIASAAIRSQISQIEKYQLALNTFKMKYAYLPGDIPEPVAGDFGFALHFASTQFFQYGNGTLEGFSSSPPMAANQVNGKNSSAGETLFFWRDLADARLIEGDFQNTGFNTVPSGVHLYSRWVPKIKLRDGAYVFVSSMLGTNYFSLISADTKNTNPSSSTAGTAVFGPSLTPLEAFNIDKKMDDGLPGTGSVISAYQPWSNVSPTTNTFHWADGLGVVVASLTLPTTAKAAVATSCTDNNNISGEQNYSIGQISGNGLNCAVTFRMK